MSYGWPAQQCRSAHMSRLLGVQTPREPHEPDFLMLSAESSRPDSCNVGVEVFA